VNLFGMLELSGSALTAERQRAEIVASNMANAKTTRTEEGGPYQRKLLLFRSHRLRAFPLMLASMGRNSGQGVRVEQVVADPTPAMRRYEPGHPDADAQGYVAYPAVNPVEEMTDLLGAVRAYELNASAIAASKSMIQQSIEILR
jgi:flagellar basal-body rod protein FlgC